MIFWVLVFLLALWINRPVEVEGYAKTHGDKVWWGRTHGDPKWGRANKDPKWGRKVGFKGYKGWRGWKGAASTPIATGVAPAPTSEQDAVAAGLNTAADSTTSGVTVAADATASGLTTGVNAVRGII